MSRVRNQFRCQHEPVCRKQYLSKVGMLYNNNLSIFVLVYKNVFDYCEVIISCQYLFKYDM